MESIYKSATPEGRQRIKDQAQKHLTDERNLKRVQAMFNRLDDRKENAAEWQRTPKATSLCTAADVSGRGSGDPAGESGPGRQMGQSVAASIQGAGESGAEGPRPR